MSGCPCEPAWGREKKKKGNLNEELLFSLENELKRLVPLCNSLAEKKGWEAFLLHAELEGHRFLSSLVLICSRRDSVRKEGASHVKLSIGHRGMFNHGQP